MKTLRISAYSTLLSLMMLVIFSGCSMDNLDQNPVTTSDELSRNVDSFDLTEEGSSDDLNAKKKWLPFIALIDVCGEELVEFQGMYHYTETLRFSDNGKIHYKFHINAKGTGVGLSSGTTYQWNDSINESANLSPGESYTFTQTWNMIGQGDAPNLRIKARFHVTVNANGELTVLFNSSTADCN